MPYSIPCVLSFVSEAAKNTINNHTYESYLAAVTLMWPYTYLVRSQTDNAALELTQEDSESPSKALDAEEVVTVSGYVDLVDNVRRCPSCPSCRRRPSLHSIDKQYDIHPFRYPPRVPKRRPYLGSGGCIVDVRVTGSLDVIVRSYARTRYLVWHTIVD